MKNSYDDLLYLPHHVSPTRPQMSMQDRAAQFSPFAALVGYDAAIDETARQTEERILLSEDRKAELDKKMHLLMQQLPSHPMVRITYFVPDCRKAGGAYVSLAGQLKKVELFERLLFLMDGTRIPLDDVIELEEIANYSE